MSELSEEQRQFIDATALWLKAHVQDKDGEIELRFGSMSNNDSFISGVNVHGWQRVRTLLCNMTPDACACPPQSLLEIVSVYDNGKYRHIEHADGTMTRQQKTAVAQRNLVFREPISKQLVACRLSHSTETSLPPKTSTSAPTLARIRARTSFWHRMWRIDVSMVQQGPNKEAAANAPTLYEIEVELEQNRIDWSRHDFHYLALSLLLKIQEISAALVGAVDDGSNSRQLPTLVAQADVQRGANFSSPIVKQ